MNFVLSKFIGGLLAPGTLLLIALFAAFAWHTRRPRLSRALLGLALLFVAALSLAPIGHWLIWPLESRFPPVSAQHLAHVDGIVVLGGAITPDDAAWSGQPALGDPAERITAFVALAREYPDAQLVWTGGSANVFGSKATFAEDRVAEQLFNALGVPPERLRYERASRNTWENAVFTQRLVAPKPGEVWLLVTSAWHMPRSVGIFRKVGWNVVPYPVDYIATDASAWGRFEAYREFYAVHFALKEWIGLISYHLLGRTSEWLPRAEPVTGDPTR